MSKIFKDTAILLIITLVAGVSLGLVYNVTKQAREEQAEKTKNEAYQTVFADASSFSDALDFDSQAVADYIAKADEATRKSDPDDPNAVINADIDEIVEAKDESGNVLGYVITVTDNEAYDGKIEFSVGITNDKVINGISFLSISETPGLGMRANTSEFMDQFKNISADYIKYSKSGASGQGEIDALSGATITSNAVTNGTTAAIYCFDYLTGGEQGE